MIEVKNLNKMYGSRVAVQDLSFTVGSGELYALLGGNGAGKTTTLHMILGLISRDSGQITVDDRIVKTGTRPRAIYVPEVVELYADLDAIETLQLFASVAGQSSTGPQCAEALNRAGLSPEHHRRRLGVYSKGMRQKVALALAEVQRARTVVLDEPTSGLDPAAAAQLAQRLQAAKDRGAAILMSTHDVLHVAGVADRVGILQSGRLVAEVDCKDMDGPALLEAYRASVKETGASGDPSLA